MPDLTLDLKYLKYAILVAEAGSFRRASERIAIAQSTVSRRVQLLERQLGTPLFERTRTGSRLTPEGRRFLQQAAIGARYLSEAAIEIHSGRGSTALLKIGILASFPVGAVTGLLGSLRERHSTIDVKLEESTAQSNVAAVLQGRLDAAVVLGSCSVVGLEAYQLGNEILYVAVPRDHALATRDMLSWEDLKDERFLVASDSAAYEIEDYLRFSLPGGAGRVKFSIQKVGRGPLLTMVAQGFGLALTTETHWRNLKFVPLGADRREVPSVLVWAHGNSKPALAKLVETGRELTGSGCVI